MNSHALIAIIDDDASVRTALKRYLRAEGFAVEGHASATEFLRSLDDRCPDCVLLDLHIPGMDGFELLEAVQAVSVERTAGVRHFADLRSSAASNAGLPITLLATRDPLLPVM
jgi:FixJ family two-component response regulator